MKRMEMKLINDFHRTEVTVRPEIVDEWTLSLSRYQANRVSRALCGMDDCHCGNHLGIRGCQNIPIAYIDRDKETGIVEIGTEVGSWR